MSLVDAEGVANLCRLRKENSRYWGDTPHLMPWRGCRFQIPTRGGGPKQPLSKQSHTGEGPEQQEQKEQAALPRPTAPKEYFLYYPEGVLSCTKHVVRAAAERHGVSLRCPTGNPARRLGCDGIGRAVTWWGGARERTPWNFGSNDEEYPNWPSWSGKLAESLCPGVGCESWHFREPRCCWNRKPPRNLSGICS